MHVLYNNFLHRLGSSQQCCWCLSGNEKPKPWLPVAAGRENKKKSGIVLESFIISFPLLGP
jgi:hypothetical protein